MVGLGHGDGAGSRGVWIVREGSRPTGNCATAAQLPVGLLRGLVVRGGYEVYKPLEAHPLAGLGYHLLCDLQMLRNANYPNRFK